MASGPMKRPVTVSSVQLIAQCEYAHTSGGGWQYTGMSFTVPNGMICLCTLATSWVSGQPTGLGLDWDSSGSPRPRIGVTETTNASMYQSPCILLSSGTYYHYARRPAASDKNPYQIYGVFLPVTA